MTVITLNPATTPATEAMLWDDVKVELIIIGENGDDILERWVTVGKKLAEIRSKNPGYRGGQFSAAARRYLEPHGLVLTGNQMSAAQWWANREQKWRDKLHAEFPDALSPLSLQKYCGEKYPEQSKNKETHTSRSSGSKNNRKNEAKPTVSRSKPNTDTDTDTDDDNAAAAAAPAAKPPSLKRQKEIAEEEHRKAVRQQIADKQAKEEEKTAKDNRPRCKEMPDPIVMFGVQVWPIAESDKARLGYYDYDQLFFGIHQFYAWYDLLPKTQTDSSRSMQLKHRLKFLWLFVDRRMTGADQIEMRRFIQVVETICDLYKADPTGECSQRPIDSCIRL